MLGHTYNLTANRGSKSDRIWLFCYLAAPRPTLGHSQGDSLTNPKLITAFLSIST